MAIGAIYSMGQLCFNTELLDLDAKQITCTPVRILQTP